MYKTLIESVKKGGLRKRKLNRIFESIREERAKLRFAIKESEETDKLNEEDVVTAVTNIVKSLADLKVNESEEIAKELEENVDELEESDDEDEKKEIAEESEEIVSDLLAEYDIDDFADDSIVVEDVEIDLEENDELDESDLDGTTDTYDVAKLDESDEPEDLENIDVDVEYIEKEYIEENEELDKLEEDVADAIEEVEELTKELEESDGEEKEEIAEELEKAIEEAEEEINEYEDAIEEDDQPAIEYVNEARRTVKRAKSILESEKEFKEEFEIDLDEDEELDEETKADIDDIVESLVGDEPDLKEQAEDALDTIQELKEELDKLEESDSEEEAPYTKEELEKMEETLSDFINESEEVDEDAVDDIIKNIGESTEADAIEEADEENKIVEEGINSLCRRLGMKASDRREFTSLFEMAVLNASKLIHGRMAKRQDMKLRRLAEGFAQMAVATGKKVLTENKKEITDRIAIVESAKANRLITEALRSNGYAVTNESTTRRVKRFEKLAESKQQEINEVKSLLKRQQDLIESQERKLIVSKIARDRNMTLSEEVKLEKMVRSLKGTDINEQKVDKVAKMFFNESRTSRPRLGKTSYIKESQTKKEVKPTVEENKKDKGEHDVLVESVLAYLGQ